MDLKARNAYLEAQIMTATPQKLRLMLIDAALRFARQTQEAIRQGNGELAFEAGSKCRSVLSELIGSIDAEHSDLTRRTLALYVFIFQRVTESQLRGQTDGLQEAIEILEVEQETWRQICEKYPDAITDPRAVREREVTASGLAPIPPSVSCPNGPDLPRTGPSISFDA